MKSNLPFSWTDENLRTAKQMHAAGRSAQEIADTIGAPSRNSVIGKFSRIKSELTPRPKIPKPIKIAPVKKQVEPYIPPEPRGNFNETPAEKQLPLEKINSQQCHYPYGETTPYLYCAQPNSPGPSPYCAYHQSLTRVKPRKTIQEIAGASVNT